MEILKRSLPIIIIRRLERHPVAVVSAISLGLRFGKETFALKRGQIDTPEFSRRMGGHVGTVSGGAAGAAAGIAAGTAVLPGIGTLLGAFAGGAIGEVLGGKLGRAAVEGIQKVTGDAETPSAYQPPKRHL